MKFKLKFYGPKETRSLMLLHDIEVEFLANELYVSEKTIQRAIKGTDITTTNTKNLAAITLCIDQIIEQKAGR